MNCIDDESRATNRPIHVVRVKGQGGKGPAFDVKKIIILHVQIKRFKFSIIKIIFLLHEKNKPREFYWKQLHVRLGINRFTSKLPK